MKNPSGARGEMRQMRDLVPKTRLVFLVRRPRPITLCALGTHFPFPVQPVGTAARPLCSGGWGCGEGTVRVAGGIYASTRPSSSFLRKSPSTKEERTT